MKNLHLFTCILFIATILVACSKEGPAGPAGPAGANGATGAAGSANVISKSFVATSLTWKDTIMYGVNFKQTRISIPEITQDVVDKGLVMTYMAIMWGEPWTALPLSYYENGYTRYFSFSIAKGQVVIRYSYSNNAVPAIPSISAKVVAVPSITNARQSAVDWNNYEEVAKIYGLSD